MAAPALMTTPLGAWSHRPRMAGLNRLEWAERRLFGVAGADEVIAEIKKRKPMMGLILGHNRLQDGGCVRLFEYLCSEERLHDHVQDITLNNTQLGDRGLLAVAKYLCNNKGLKELQLQNNLFTCNAEVWTTFTSALNSSHLRRLTLSSNQQLSDEFLSAFLATLSSSHFEELVLSFVGLTAASAPVIIDFLSSTRARSLKHMTLNGNELGREGLFSIIDTVEKSNFHLTRCEMYANWSANNDEERQSWNDAVARLSLALTRNQVLGRNTGREALVLLRHARPALLQHTKPSEDNQPTPRLPNELVLHILSFFAPTLSATQRRNVVDYASDPRSLPSLPQGLPPLGKPTTFIGSSRDLALPAVMEARTEWLIKVQCDAYDPQTDSIRYFISD
ncbi:hypothetical protein PENSPDRAFT_635798 [Peniophora sp. CONT]|nr:hypothetical protein PENSPDRAFT_635798 [Peniophora sp. CONT]